MEQSKRTGKSDEFQRLEFQQRWTFTRRFASYYYYNFIFNHLFEGKEEEKWKILFAFSFNSITPKFPFLKISFSLFYRTNNHSKDFFYCHSLFFANYSSRCRNGIRIRWIWPRIGREIETHARSITKHFHRSRFARFSARGSGRPRNLGCEFARFPCPSTMT